MIQNESNEETFGLWIDSRELIQDHHLWAGFLVDVLGNKNVYLERSL